MTSCFGDTSYFLALLIPADVSHASARRWAEQNRAPITTSEYVVVEVGNYLSPAPTRSLFSGFLKALRSDGRVSVVPASSDLLDRGAELYRSRSDKGWSLTDSISFVIMLDQGIREALTADHHFEQAGFTALLKPGS